MNTEIKSKWIKALRSGAYTQAVGELRNTNKEGSFCCLGVLVDILEPNKWKDKEHQFSHCGLLSEDFCREISLSNHLMSHLAEMNDDGVSFANIADLIESEA